MVEIFSDLHDGDRAAKRGTDQIQAGDEIFAPLTNDKQCSSDSSLFCRTA